MIRQRLAQFARNILLLLLGVSAAIVSLMMYGSDVLLSFANSTSGDRIAAVACIPETETDDIFFISCGGIY